MAVFNSAVFYSGVYFTDSAVKTGTGGIDPGEGNKRRRIIKPTGLLHLPKKEGRKDVVERIEESREIQAEIAGRLAKDFAAGNAVLEAAQTLEMSVAEIDAEIGMILRKKIRTEEDEMILLLLMAAAVA
ncbi:MAG TPA: hypothetical protein VIH29_07115 [Gallionella sp.]